MNALPKISVASTHTHAKYGEILNNTKFSVIHVLHTGTVSFLKWHTSHSVNSGKLRKVQ